MLVWVSLEAAISSGFDEKVTSGASAAAIVRRRARRRAPAMTR